MPPKKDLKKQAPPIIEQPKIEQPVIPQHQLRGYGRFEYPNGAVYEGRWQLHNGIKMKEGQGEITIPGYGLSRIGSEKYTGQWKLDMMEGYGTYTYASGAIYKGEWKSGKQNGRGVYQFPDGSIYQGQWINHQMCGQGKLINSKGKVFQGIYVDGTFQSRNQDQLRKQKQNRLKSAQIIASVTDYFNRFSVTFGRSQKKTFKQNLLPFFATQQQVKLHIKDPFPKYQQRTPQKWQDAFTQLRTQGVINILKDISECSFFDSQRVLSPQFEGLGQVIQVKTTIGQRIIRASLCQVTNQSIVIVFYHDSADTKK